LVNFSSLVILANEILSARPKENSPTSGLLRLLVARGGIEPPIQGVLILMS